MVPLVTALVRYAGRVNQCLITPPTCLFMGQYLRIRHHRCEVMNCSCRGVARPHQFL